MAFVVLDRAQPPQRASVTRTVTLLAPCATGLFWCGVSCQTVDCAVSAALLQRGEPAVLDPPSVTLVGVEPAVETEAGGTLTLSYGVAYPNVSLAPCASYNNTDGCRAVAWHEGEGDVSAFVQVQQVQCDGCAGCAVDLVAAGVCPPGVYSYRYSVADLAAQVGGATLEVSAAPLGESLLPRPSKLL